jgi:hypothetical protein
MALRKQTDEADLLLEMPAVKDRYEELKELNRLPILKRRPSSGGKKQDPFFVHNRF